MFFIFCLKIGFFKPNLFIIKKRGGVQKAAERAFHNEEGISLSPSDGEREI